MTPSAGKFERILIGADLGLGSYSPYNFYEMFSGSGVGGQPSSKSRGGKPFIVAETAATFHLSIDGNATVPPEGPGRVSLKRTWWQQFLNQTFLSLYPKIKAIGTFEFIKHEETSWRDFTVMGDTGTGIHSPFGNDGGTQSGPVLAAFQQDLSAAISNNWIVLGNYTLPAPVPLPTLPPVKKNNQSFSPVLHHFLALLMMFWLLY